MWFPPFHTALNVPTSNTFQKLALFWLQAVVPYYQHTTLSGDCVLKIVKRFLSVTLLFLYCYFAEFLPSGYPDFWNKGVKNKETE